MNNELFKYSLGWHRLNNDASQRSSKIPAFMLGFLSAILLVLLFVLSL